MRIQRSRMFFLIPLAVLSLMCGVSGAASFRAIHGASSEAYNAWAQKAAADGYQVIFIDGVGAGSVAQFAAVAEKGADPPPTEAHIDLTGAEYQKTFDALAAKGYRVISLRGYRSAGTPRFAAVWVRDGAGGAWEAHHDLSARDFQEMIDRLAKRGLRPDVVSGYPDGAGTCRLAAVFVEAGKTPWIARQDLTANQYQKLFDEYAPKGYRPTSVTAYPGDGGVRFAAVFVHDETPWVARHDLTAAQYQAEFEQHAKEGFHPLCIAAYAPAEAAGPEVFEQAMKTFMDERQIPAGTLAVSRDGTLLLSRAFGVADPATHRRTEPDDPMRLASVCKPITAAAIRKLIREGKLTPDTKVFPLLALRPPAGQTPDPRINDITVLLLLDHKGGWDCDNAFDPMFRPLVIAKALGKPGPASAEDVVRYMIGQPLQFTPGERACYSNFGYCVLGRVIEKVTGETYITHVQRAILAPLGIKSVELARTLPRDRNPREPAYVDPGKGRDVVAPRSRAEVPAPDGTFYIEAMDAHGGMIGSAPDLIRFLNAYWITGEPRKGNGQSWLFFGSLPGTWTMVQQQANGVNVAALFNQRTVPSGLPYEKIAEMMQDAGGKLGGEVRYAAVWVKEPP